MGGYYAYSYFHSAQPGGGGGASSSSSGPGINTLKKNDVGNIDLYCGTETV